MSVTNCDTRRDCTIFVLVASTIIGVVTALLRITEVITISPVFFWAIFGISVWLLTVTLIAVVAGGKLQCLCAEKSLEIQLLSILAAILLALILLAIEFVTTSVAGAILTGLALLFFSLSLGSTACLIKCYAKCSD